MLLTEKRLRKTIRKILIENQQHYEKLAALIVPGQKEDVKQAMELLDAVGYADVEYKQSEWHAGIHHGWKLCNYDPEFAEVLEVQHQIRTGNKIVPRFSINFYHDRDLIAISFSEVIEDEETFQKYYGSPTP